MSPCYGQNSAIAKGSWNREVLQEVQPIYHWHDFGQNMKEYSASPLEGDSSLPSSLPSSTEDCLLLSLENTITVIAGNQRQAYDSTSSTEEGTAPQLRPDEIADSTHCITSLIDPEFRDLINYGRQKGANPVFIESNTTEQSHSQCILGYPQKSHVAQLYHDPKVLSTISEGQTKRGSYHCSHCSEKYATLVEFAAHLDEFNLERPCKCPIEQCPWKILGFQQATGLRRHCASQHIGELDIEMEKSLNLKVEKYPGLNCPFPICQKTFRRKDAYKRHVAMVHNNADSRFNKRLKKILNNTK
ncbi:AIG_G0020540.mRNA.1.CDS.1 [Saccharomyces cerevisiae]|nr:AIG_G0020540.mRNA.1.CDS.1 [Saccharomyces cerevisiae]CAI6679131.1 AIG_G0020540.mRNA.1.CDS.1 [Saccharomyces cerevisiae]